jgi:hypothetical protein
MVEKSISFYLNNVNKYHTLLIHYFININIKSRQL